MISDGHSPKKPVPRFTRGRTRLVLTLLLGSFLTTECAFAEKFCVAPDGDDANPGTKEQPFATIQRAQQAAAPGDFVYLRGGTYRMKESDIATRDGFRATLTFLDKNGRKGQPISYHAMPGEHPVFDCSDVKPRGLRVNAFQVRASWIHLKGIEVTGVQVTATDHTQSICFENTGSHNIYEQLGMHDGQAIGLYITRGSDNLVLNCDAYRNYDFTSENGRGGNTDGFGCHAPDGGSHNVFMGCRAWFNSDDGFDCINASEEVKFVNCWAFYNGYTPDFKPHGDGNGFKAGGYGIAPDARFPSPVPRHRVSRCLAVGNRSAGFYANHHPGGIDWIDNAAYKNSVNYNFLCRSSDASSDIPGRSHKILDNLSYKGTHDFKNLDLTQCEHAGNWFDHPQKLTDADFINLDESTLTAPRQANGDLPDIGFMRLKRKSL
jgi:hypothetical protein